MCSLVHSTKAKGNFALCREWKFTAVLRLFALHRDNTSQPALGFPQTYRLQKERNRNSCNVLSNFFFLALNPQSGCLICMEVEHLINFCHKPAWESKHTQKKCLHWKNSVYVILEHHLHQWSSEGNSWIFFVIISSPSIDKLNFFNVIYSEHFMVLIRKVSTSQ